jgi:hypothetical protein
VAQPHVHWAKFVTVAANATERGWASDGAYMLHALHARLGVEQSRVRAMAQCVWVLLRDCCLQSCSEAGDASMLDWIELAVCVAAAYYTSCYNRYAWVVLCSGTNLAVLVLLAPAVADAAYHRA